MSIVNLPAADSSIRLRDGRALGYLEVGKTDGVPIFHFHGHGSSRLEVRLIAGSAAVAGVRLIGLDRPGIGHSDPRPGAQILDWPDDVVEAADQLGVQRFAVEGVSGGGLYALACAYKIPHRLTACGVISTVSPPALMRQAGPPYLRVMWWMGAYLPWLFQPLTRLLTRLSGSDEASIEKYLIQYAAQLGVADQRLLAVPENRRLLAEALAESHRQGSEANLDETMAGIRPLGFEIEQVTFEQMYLWHGEQDHVMPIAPARLLAQELPHCAAVFYPDEGHFSTLTHHARDILTILSA